MSELCQAGSRCGLGGKWTTPCSSPAIHGIANPGSEPILLCDKHFREVSADGLVKDENIGKEEFDRREQKREEKATECLARLKAFCDKQVEGLTKGVEYYGSVSEPENDRERAIKLAAQLEFVRYIRDGLERVYDE